MRISYWSSDVCSSDLLVDLVLEALVQLVDRAFELRVERFQVELALVVLDRDLAPLARREVAQHLLGDPGAGLHALGAGDGGLVQPQVPEAAVEAALQDHPLAVAVLGQALALRPRDGQHALALVAASPREPAPDRTATGPERRV